jgi:hypothetical protein
MAWLRKHNNVLGLSGVEHEGLSLRPLMLLSYYTVSGVLLVPRK